MFWAGIEANAYWIVFAIGVLIVALWECLAPFRTVSAHLSRRWISHAGLVCIASGMMMLVRRTSLVLLALAASHNRFALLNKPGIPLVARAAIAFLLLDLLRYALHRVFHSYGWLWKVHQVHHSDPDFDLSTGLRNHPLEALISQAVLSSGVILLAPPVSAVLAMELAALLQSFFSHANANLPPRLERIVGFLIYTPQLHRIHHSQEIREQNANFGEIFPWWDRIFGSFVAQPQAGFDGIAIGLNGAPGAESANLLQMLREPFLPAPGAEQLQALDPGR